MINFSLHKALLSAMIMLVLLPAVSGAVEVGENQVKVAMVYNMLKFVDWPSDAFLGQPSQLTVCVQGKGALAGSLELLRGREVKGRQLVVRGVSKSDDLIPCQVLVFTDADKRVPADFLAPVGLKSLLTVSDLPRFAVSGGVVGFYEEAGRVKFEINLGAAQRNRIKISSQLLKLARIVKDE